jgi:pyruvate-ferredoxin/flavodoxin oxidoreductase
MSRRKVTIDGNEAAAYIAYKTNEVIAIYPITPSSGMGELSDAWSSDGKKNIWGTVPSVIEMQSEGGAVGALHGALQSGSLATTFTSSQGLLLMIPNMYKIAGELTPTVFHIAARSIAAQALSIFGDHSDVMACRQTGYAQLSSNNPQEVMDLALIAQASTLESRIPFLHFFDGFRTSHEVRKIEQLADDDIRAMIDDELIFEHRRRALTPDDPVLRGSAQNPDVYFQGRESVNPFYERTPGIVQNVMNKFETLTGRQYRLFEYVGSPEAERVLILMGSGADAAEETVEHLVGKNEDVGILKVRLFRPFSVEHFINAVPKTVKSIAVLDRTKEPGSIGEPLYQDVVTAFSETLDSENPKFKSLPTIVGGRYGLSSKEFTPAMIQATFDELDKTRPKNHFTVGIYDDVSKTSLDFDPEFDIEPAETIRAMFFGLGADGTVGANKNSIKIIGEETENYAQGYFVYDSKKSGSMTTSHLRFGKKPIRSTYLIHKANFIACHQEVFLEKIDMLKYAIRGATFLVNSLHPADTVWNSLPRRVQEQIIEKKIKLYVIDGYKVARETGMGGRVNTIMQTCFFAISGVLPKDEAIAKIKDAINKTYGSKGEEVVQKNFNAVDKAVENLHEVEIPSKPTSTIELPPVVSDRAPAYVKEFTADLVAGLGDTVPVSRMPVDGTFETATAKWEKRNIATEVPVWDPDVCIQCGKCVLVCPHATIRQKVYDETVLAGAPDTFKSTTFRGKEFADMKYTIQVAVEDCTGCSLCVEVCPAKNKKETRLKAINMEPQLPLRERERENWDFFLNIPEIDRRTVKTDTIKGSQFLEPLFEFSGACAGCGETPYVKLVSQLYGDRMIVANATGCSSIYGGNLPTTPWAKNADGRGPAWSNSLFEDNAEFGLGMRLSIDKNAEYSRELVDSLKDRIGTDLAGKILANPQNDEADIFEQRGYVDELKKKLAASDDPQAKRLRAIADYLVKKSVWIMGGDGWAYDIGYGGLDHVLASGKNVNILVLDTEVYSNTGGQMSKSTPRAAVAKFAASGKPLPKKDLALIAMTYRDVFVAKIAMGSNDVHTVKAIIEAEKFDGPSLIIAYSHCIAHGINMAKAMDNQKAAVDSGHWPLFRYNPDNRKAGKKALTVDSKPPKIPFEQYAYMETRFKMLTKSHPDTAKKLIQLAQSDTDYRYHLIEKMADVLDGAVTGSANGGGTETNGEEK